MANSKITDIEGIGPAYAKKLAAVGIGDTDTLLEKGCTKPGRSQIAKTCSISEKRVLKWVNAADLFRIKGVAGEYAELLELAGVDTVKELAQRKAENLAARMAEVNSKKNVTRKVPSEGVVAGWVSQAKELPGEVTH